MKLVLYFFHCTHQTYHLKIHVVVNQATCFHFNFFFYSRLIKLILPQPLSGKSCMKMLICQNYKLSISNGSSLCSFIFFLGVKKLKSPCHPSLAKSGLIISEIAFTNCYQQKNFQLDRFAPSHIFLNSQKNSIPLPHQG